MKIEEIANLIKIEINDEVEDYFNQRLDYLKEILSLKTEPLIDERETIVRDDIVITYPKREEIVSGFEEREGDYLKVKKILNE